VDAFKAGYFDDLPPLEAEPATGTGAKAEVPAFDAVGDDELFPFLNDDLED
jgi:hypothetical protein